MILQENSMESFLGLMSWVCCRTEYQSVGSESKADAYISKKAFEITPKSSQNEKSIPISNFLYTKPINYELK
jgi:hypothetical protein